MFKDFREFAVRGNVMDLAVGVIIGAAFGKIVASLVSDVIMPPIGMLMGKMDFSNLFIDLSRSGVTTLAEAKTKGIPTINYGAFLNTCLDFLIVAFVIFLMVRWINRLKAEPAPAPAAPTTKDCSFCLSVIPLKATRCPNCTSQLS